MKCRKCEIDKRIASRDTRAMKTVEEARFEKIALPFGRREFSKMIAESAKRRSPEIFDGGFAVGKSAAVIWEKRQVSSGMKGNSDQLSQIDGVDVLVSGVKTEEEAGRGTLERVSSVIGIG
jgi:hypothetical protein